MVSDDLPVSISVQELSNFRTKIAETLNRIGGMDTKLKFALGK